MVYCFNCIGVSIVKNNRHTKPKRIFLIDDHPAVRQGLKLLLAQEDHVVCGEASSSAETLVRIGSSQADLALLDISLGEESGLECIADLRRRGISVLVYSMHEDAVTIDRAFAAGADGYVSKREQPEVLLAAVADVLAGNRHISPRTAQSLAERAVASPDTAKEVLLSEREKQILYRLGQGESNAEIAAALAIGVRTVETYYARMIDKLGLDGMKALRRYAIRKL
jgi:two-component system, NarL family, invasion response regulator UvrY